MCLFELNKMSNKIQFAVDPYFYNTKSSWGGTRRTKFNCAKQNCAGTKVSKSELPASGEILTPFSCLVFSLFATSAEIYI